MMIICIWLLLNALFAVAMTPADSRTIVPQERGQLSTCQRPEGDQ
jgi:hypothetical protein